jgi:hypothetical protein
MPTIFSEERKSREIERRRRQSEHRQDRVDSTLVGTVREYLNGWKVVFMKNGAYYLVDNFGNSEHICSYSKREKMFSFLDYMDMKLHFSDEIEMGHILFAFSRKNNVWIKY